MTTVSDIGSQKVKILQAKVPQGPAGRLVRESQFVFNYDTQDRDCELSLTMPLRAQSYVQNTVHPVFAMNLPEGALHTEIRLRFAKQFAKLDEMAMLSITGADRIGRITLSQPNATTRKRWAQVGLKELLGSSASQELFEFLVDNYLDAGISGVQPKVLVPDADRPADTRASVLSSDLIVKMAGPDHPNLCLNEHACMDAARRAGLDVPEFWLSADASLFIIRRFDIDAHGKRLGFEDMAALNRSTYDEKGNYKYVGNYEGILKLINALTPENKVESSQRFFEYFVLSCMVRNGAAHLKNFGLLYESPDRSETVRLSPLFDVVTTSAYDFEDRRTGRAVSDRTLALKFNKSAEYPMRDAVLAFGTQCFVKKPAEVIERIGTSMSESLDANKDRFPRDFFLRMRAEWDGGRSLLEPNRVFPSP